jgi:DNA-directed RNA polymerase subunit beta'
MLGWSYGEVKKPETINYRTHRPEVDGLMDEKIFGPTKNFECYCGKYKKIRYKGIICDKCGVEVTHKRVRRERMGHIKLATPVTHVWFAHGVPNKLALILGITQKKLETVIYFARYLVTSVDEAKKADVVANIKAKKEEEVKTIRAEVESKLQVLESEMDEEIAKIKNEESNEKKLKFKIDKLNNDLKKESAKIKSVYTQKETNVNTKFDAIIELTEGLKKCSSLSEDDKNVLYDYGVDFFESGMGAEAIKLVLDDMNLENELISLKEEAEKSKSLPKRRKILQRVRLMEGMVNAGIGASWLILDVLPVIPPDLRPIIQLPGGRFATSDLNDLYRRVLNRNNRLRRLVNLGAPEIILRNEKRMLQEAVDALIDNEHRSGNPVLNSRGLPYKSLSDMLRGKQGRFRQNLLGKRVDYSGRSVIVSGPELTIDQCGLPKTMALELFKPFVLRQIILEGLAPNIKSAKLFFESKAPKVWDLLEKVIKDRPVLLNRAPTLHRQGIQAFFPVLTEGNAIRLHPMVCKGFNADFDGDQMAVHVPLSDKAVEEARTKLFTRQNILLMADGNPVVNVDKDMALGMYYLTGMINKDKKKFFGNEVEVVGRYESGELDLREEIVVLYKGKLLDTTAGRLIFNAILPEGIEYVNRQLNKKEVAKLSATIFDVNGADAAADFLGNVEKLGFKFATESALTLGMSEFIVNPNKDTLLKEIEVKEDQLMEDYYAGLVTEEERKRLFEKMWLDLIEKVSQETWDNYKTLEDNNIVTLEESGAAPVQNPLRQIAGIRGLILDPLGKIVQLPLRSNYKEGLSALEYFVAARGTRKGLADTALKTAESGYLTRRLCDVAQDVIVRQEDCGTHKGILLEKSKNRRMTWIERINGRYTLDKVVNPSDKKVIVGANEEITPEIAKAIDAAGVEELTVRSVMTCKLVQGVCQKCYGYNLGTRKTVEKGIAVGIIAAQSMGEAATQLTLNTKHLSGRVGTDITQGLPRVEELFEARTPKAKSILSQIDGKVEFVKSENEEITAIKVAKKIEYEKSYVLDEGDTTEIKKSKAVKQGDKLITRKNGEMILSPEAGKVTKTAEKLVLVVDKEVEDTYELDPHSVIIVNDGDQVIKGTQLTAGSIDPKELLNVNDIESAQQYLIDNIQETYGIQGISLDDKHVEVIVRQMSRFTKIMDGGDSALLPGSFLEITSLNDENEKLKAASENAKTIKAIRQLVGITVAAIKTESFLSAASFEQQVRVLSEAAIAGKYDYLRGLKENVIIGRTVPLGDAVNQ